MITKLTLKNFKSFGATGGEIPLGPLTLIVGTNASGKSNIRDALRFLHGIGRGYSLAEIIGGKYSEAGEHVWDGIRGGWPEMINKASGASTLTITVESAPGSSVIDTGDLNKIDTISYGAFRYSIEIGVTKPNGTPRVRNEILEEIGRRVVFTTKPSEAPKGLPVIYRLNRTMRGSGYQITGNGPHLDSTQPVLTQLAQNKGIHREPYLACNAFLYNLFYCRFFDFSPEALRQPSMPGNKYLGGRGHNLSSVLQDLCDDEDTRAAIVSWIQELTPSDVVELDFPTVDLEGRIQVALKENGGMVISAASASDGTLRFLAYLATLFGADTGKNLFIEELENGIHPNRIDLLIRLFQMAITDSETQIMATTHSPALISFLGGKALDDALLVTRAKRGSVVRRFADLELPEQDRGRPGELLRVGWFELEADHLETDKRKGGKA